MKIEKLRIEDLKEYKELIDEAFESSNDLSKYNYDENSKSYEVLVLKDENRIVATVTMYKIELFTFSFQPSIELFNVAVKKECRNKGYGSAIINHVIEYAKSNGYKSIHFTCLESEKYVHSFYESLGFKKMDSRKYNMSL